MSIAQIQTDIEGYLASYQSHDLLRLITCGSVDDGKSSLIGRLLYDSNQIFEDHLQALEKDSAKLGTTGGAIDLALLVDGLQAEREQGITIDVAYRYFNTDKRKFIIADTPGHEQYTRNMATGASTADTAVILIDARKGLLPQTKRHSYIVHLLGIRHIIVAINKMDLVDYDQLVFESIRQDFEQQINASLGFDAIDFVPVSALLGDNVVHSSEQMPWYAGSSLLTLLETLNVTPKQEAQGFKMAVQYVNRPNLDFRGYCGTVASGQVKVDDPVMVLPSGKQSHITSIVTADGELTVADTDMAITLTLADEVDISRGDWLVHPTQTQMMQGQRAIAMLVWMSETPLTLHKRYWFKTGARWVMGEVTQIDYLVNINTYQTESASEIPLNGIAHCCIRLDEMVVMDAYHHLRRSGSMIVVDRMTNATVGAVMVESLSALNQHDIIKRDYSPAEIALNAFIRQQYPEWGCQAIEQGV